MAKVSVSLGELTSMESSLKELVEMHLPIVVSFKLAKIVKAVFAELKDVEEKRRELVKKHGDTKENGDVVVPEDKIVQFNTEFKELLSVVVEVDIPVIRIHEFGDGIEIPPRIMIQLESFITE